MGFNSGGSNQGNNQSSSGPLSPIERMNTLNALWNPTYQGGGSAFGPNTTQQGMNLQAITPTAADFKTLANGDYNRLEQQIATSRMAPVNAAWGVRSGEIDQDMAKRGIFSSGAGISAKNKEWRTSVLPASVQAGADAATQRYGQQATDLQNQWAAKWKQPEFLAAIFNGTNAQVSNGYQQNSGDGGWGIKI